jgi:hypothetical protein
MQRLARLEHVIEELSCAKVADHPESGSDSSSKDKGHTKEQASERLVRRRNSDGGSDGNRTSTGTEVGMLETGLGKLLVSEGKSRYIGPNFWASLSEEVGSQLLIFLDICP